jgi:hypothetical protein
MEAMTSIWWLGIVLDAAKDIVFVLFVNLLNHKHEILATATACQMRVMTIH